MAALRSTARRIVGRALAQRPAAAVEVEQRRGLLLLRSSYIPPPPPHGGLLGRPPPVVVRWPRLFSSEAREPPSSKSWGETLEETEMWKQSIIDRLHRIDSSLTSTWSALRGKQPMQETRDMLAELEATMARQDTNSPELPFSDGEARCIMIIILMMLIANKLVKKALWLPPILVTLGYMIAKAKYCQV